MLPRLFAISAALSSALPAPSAQAQAQIIAPCGRHGVMVEMLKVKYGEVSVARGISRGGDAIVIYVSKSGGFTVLMRVDRDLSCIIAAGDDFEIDAGFGKRGL